MTVILKALATLEPSTVNRAAVKVNFHIGNQKIDHVSPRHQENYYLQAFQRF